MEKQICVGLQQKEAQHSVFINHSNENEISLAKLNYLKGFRKRFSNKGF